PYRHQDGALGREETARVADGAPGVLRAVIGDDDEIGRFGGHHLSPALSVEYSRRAHPRAGAASPAPHGRRSVPGVPRPIPCGGAHRRTYYRRRARRGFSAVRGTVPAVVARRGGTRPPGTAGQGGGRDDAEPGTAVRRAQDDGRGRTVGGTAGA